MKYLSFLLFMVISLKFAHGGIIEGKVSTDLKQGFDKFVDLLNTTRLRYLFKLSNGNLSNQNNSGIKGILPDIGIHISPPPIIPVIANGIEKIKNYFLNFSAKNNASNTLPSIETQAGINGTVNVPSVSVGGGLQVGNDQNPQLPIGGNVALSANGQPILANIEVPATKIQATYGQSPEVVLKGEVQVPSEVNVQEPINNQGTLAAQQFPNDSPPSSNGGYYYELKNENEPVLNRVELPSSNTDIPIPVKLNNQGQNIDVARKNLPPFNHVSSPNGDYNYEVKQKNLPVLNRVQVGGVLKNNQLPNNGVPKVQPVGGEISADQVSYP